MPVCFVRESSFVQCHARALRRGRSRRGQHHLTSPNTPNNTNPNQPQAPPLIFKLKKIIHQSHRIHIDELSPSIYYSMTREVGGLGAGEETTHEMDFNTQSPSH